MFDFLLTERGQYSAETGGIWFDLTARVRPSVSNVESADAGTTLVTSSPRARYLLDGTREDRISRKDVKLVSSRYVTSQLPRREKTVSIFFENVHIALLCICKTFLISGLLVGTTLLSAEPPFHGTIFVNKSIVVDDDPTVFDKATSIGVGQRRMFDRRTNRFAEVEARLYQAEFKNGMKIEVQVNIEFDEEQAQQALDRYLPVVGQLPAVLRKDVKTMWIHKGKEPFGGGNDNLLIHTGMGEVYLRDGILAETLCHEAAHTSLDATHASNDRWLAAQRLDGEFISQYARDNPGREDIAESFLLYVALRYRRDRIPNDLAETIETTMPNRIQYFDSLELDMRPITNTSASR